ncbi:MAG: hypothetical protein ACHQM6_01920 [Candidatus Kapaibacterium sp.]
MYPRQLQSQEKEILLWLLPDNISGYKSYADFIQNSQVIGEGRWGEGNLLMDKKLSAIDRTLGMSPVVAYGECTINDSPLSIGIHEFNIDDQLEIQFSGLFPIPESPDISNKWCYSYWKPGNPCPATGIKVREVIMYDSRDVIKYVLAISSAKKVLWLHHTVSGFNQLIPVTAFYDELLRVKHNRDAALISHPVTFFDKINDFSDAEYITALLAYDKKASRKFDPSDIVIPEVNTKKSLFQKLFAK